MRINKLLKLLVLSSVFLYASQALAETKVRLDRKPGAVSAAFNELMENYLKQFPDGIGRMQLATGSSKNQCVTDLYVSKDSIFVAYNSQKDEMSFEFYADHPHENFKGILFQTLIKSKSGGAINVDTKDGGYKISKDEQELVVEIKKQGSSSRCEFDLAKAEFFPGQSE